MANQNSLQGDEKREQEEIDKLKEQRNKVIDGMVQATLVAEVAKRVVSQNLKSH